MTCAIVSRDEKVCETLKDALQHWTSQLEIDSTHVLRNGETGAQWNLSCDVVFAHFDAIGAELPHFVNGFSENCPLFVFVLQQPAKHAKKMNSCALDYLQMPVSVKECRELENRLSDLCTLRREKAAFAPAYYSAIQHLISNWSKRTWHEVVLPDVNGYSIVSPREVVRLECEGPYTSAFLSGGRRVLTCKPIKHYEEVLDSYGFVRIQPTQIINLHHIQSWQSERGVEVTLTDGTVLPVSMRRVPLFLEAFQQWSRSNGASR